MSAFRATVLAGRRLANASIQRLSNKAGRARQLAGNRRETTNTPKTPRNSGTLSRPKRFLYQSPYRTSHRRRTTPDKSCTDPSSCDIGDKATQGGLCRQEHRNRNADPKIGREGRKAGRDPKDNYEQHRKPTKTQGPCPDLRGTCIKALTVCQTTSPTVFF